MNSALSALGDKIQHLAGGLLAFGFGVSDLWRFHAIGTNGDLIFVVGGLAAMGIPIAYSAGLNADPVPPKTTTP